MRVSGIGKEFGAVPDGGRGGERARGGADEGERTGLASWGEESGRRGGCGGEKKWSRRRGGRTRLEGGFG